MKKLLVKIEAEFEVSGDPFIFRIDISGTPTEPMVDAMKEYIKRAEEAVYANPENARIYPVLQAPANV